jgi:hypothetical protein
MSCLKVPLALLQGNFHRGFFDTEAGVSIQRK